MPIYTSEVKRNLPIETHNIGSAIAAGSRFVYSDEGGFNLMATQNEDTFTLGTDATEYATADAGTRYLPALTNGSIKLNTGDIIPAGKLLVITFWGHARASGGGATKLFTAQTASDSGDITLEEDDNADFTSPTTVTVRWKKSTTTDSDDQYSTTLAVDGKVQHTEFSTGSALNSYRITLTVPSSGRYYRLKGDGTGNQGDTKVLWGLKVRIGGEDDSDVTELVSNHSVKFQIDANSDHTDSTSKFSFTAGSGNTEIAQIDESGNLQIDGNLSVSGDTHTFTSANTNDPLITIQNTTSDATSARLKFNKSRGNDGEDGDDIGDIQFWSYNDGIEAVQQYAGILAEIKDASSNNEGGKLSLKVAEHDGTVTSGLVIEDGDADGEIDVTIGAGAASLTTIAGDLSVSSSISTPRPSARKNWLRLGSGQEGMNAELQINGYETAATIAMYHDSSASDIGDGTGLGQIVFGATENSGTNYYSSAWIMAKADENSWASNNLDTRLEFALAKDSSNSIVMTLKSDGKVGIGATDPGALLEVRGPAGTGAAAAGVLQLSTAETSVVDTDQLGRIEFLAPKEAAGTDAILVGASIYAEADDTFAADNNETELVFATAATAAAAERMRITSDGKVGIGTSAPSHDLSVITEGDLGISVDRSNDNSSYQAWMRIRRSRGTSSSPTIVADNDYLGCIEFSAYDGSEYEQAALIYVDVDDTPGANDTPGRMMFATTPNGTRFSVERMRIDSKGNVGIGTNAPQNPLDIYQMGGLILSYVALDHASLQAYTTTTSWTTIASGDQTAVITFVAPASGKVELQVQCYAKGDVDFQFLHMSIGAAGSYDGVAADEHHVWQCDETDDTTITTSWVLTGLTAGTSYTRHIAAKKSGGGSGTIYVQWGASGATNGRQPFIIRAVSLPSTVVTDN